MGIRKKKMHLSLYIMSVRFNFPHIKVTNRVSELLQRSQKGCYDMTLKVLLNLCALICIQVL